MIPAVEEALILVNRIVNKYQTEHDQTRNPVVYLVFPKYITLLLIYASSERPSDENGSYCRVFTELDQVGVYN
jgi:hypothetical protein